MKTRMLVAIAAVILMSGALALAQTPTSIEIGFPFVAGGKTLAAGKYTVETPDINTVSIYGPGGKSIMVVLTQLGRHDQDTDLELVFDKLDGKYHLSEVWFPERDGLLLLATKKPHEHAVLGGSKPRK